MKQVFAGIMGKEIYVEHEPKIEDRVERIFTYVHRFISNYSIWCRNGTVCNRATHCKKLLCKYKDHSSDISKGCALCRNFQITTKSNNWYKASHVCEYADVTPHKGN